MVTDSHTHILLCAKLGGLGLISGQRIWGIMHGGCKVCAIQQCELKKKEKRHINKQTTQMKTGHKWHQRDLQDCP